MSKAVRSALQFARCNNHFVPTGQLMLCDRSRSDDSKERRRRKRETHERKHKHKHKKHHRHEDGERHDKRKKRHRHDSEDDNRKKEPRVHSSDDDERMERHRHGSEGDDRKERRVHSSDDDERRERRRHGSEGDDRKERRVNGSEDDERRERPQAAKTERKVPISEIDDMLDEWVKHKRMHNFEEADRLRDKLQDLGVNARLERPDELKPHENPHALRIEKWIWAQRIHDYTTADEIRNQLRADGVDVNAWDFKPADYGVTNVKWQNRRGVEGRPLSDLEIKVREHRMCAPRAALHAKGLSVRIPLGTHSGCRRRGRRTMSSRRCSASSCGLRASCRR